MKLLERLTYILLLSTLISGCNRYRVNQTSLVPAAVLSPPVGFKPGFDGSLTGAYNVGSEGHLSSGKDSSLYINRGSVLTALEYSGQVVGGRLQIFQGFDAGATRVTRKSIGKPSGMVWAVGPGMVFRALGEHPTHRLTIDASTLFVVAPSRVRAACTDCMDDDLAVDRSGTYEDRSVAFMPSFGLQHRILLTDQVRVIWGLNLQTSVTNSYELDRSIPGRSKVHIGAPHPSLMGGVEWSPTPWASVQPGLAFIGPPSPAIYLPTALLTIRFHTPSDFAEPAVPPAPTGLRVLDQDLASFQDARFRKQ